MTTTAKVGVGTLIVLAILLIGIALFLLLVDWNRFSGRAGGWLSAAAGREVTIGDLDVQPGRVTRVALSDLRIANRAWAQGADLARMERLVMDLRLLPLLRGELVVPALVMQRPVLNLEKAEDGRVNWDLGAAVEEAAEVAAPEERTEVPRIERIVVEEGRVTYREPARKLNLQGRIDTATGETGEELRLELEGRLQQRPMQVSVRGGSLSTLRDEDRPFPMRAELRVGKTRARLEGTAQGPLQLAGMQARLVVDGPTLSEVFHLYGTPLPPTAPFRLEATVQRGDEAFHLEDFRGRIGNSEVRGRVALHVGGERPRLEARLTSDHLDLQDLGGLVGLDRQPEKETGRLFPDTPLATDRLRDMDVDVRLTSTHIETPPLPLRQVDIRFRLRNGVLDIAPFVFSAVQGRFAGDVRVDANARPVAASARVAVQGLGLAPFFRGSEIMRHTRGRFFGAIRLAGEGRSVAEIMANARGRAEIGMNEGSVSGLVLEAAGLDLVEALALAVEGTTPVPVRCLVFRADVRDGIVDLQRTFIDTTDSVLLVGGKVNLARETLDLQIEAREKDFSLIDASSPIRVSGSFRKLSYAIEDFDLLPFFEMGEAKDRDCRGQLAALKGKPLESKKLHPGG